MRKGKKRLDIPWGLVGMLAIVALVETRLADQPIERASKLSRAWRFSGEAAGDEAVGAVVLCLGDSLVKLGVQPRVIETKLGASVYNLAAPGAQAPASFFLLRRALEAGAKPSVLIVNIQENLLAVAPRSNVESWPDLLDGRDWLDLALHGLDPELAARVGLARLLPSLRDRRAIRDQIVAALSGRDRAILPELRALDRNWRQNAGGQVASVGVRRPFAFTPVPGGERSGRSWRPHPVNASYVHRLLDLANRRGITVLLLLPPAQPDWLERREALGLVEPLDEFLDGLVASYPNVKIVDGRRAGYPAEVFRDPTHLDGQGAVALSLALADLIRPDLDDDAVSVPTDPRWVALPTFEPPAGPLPLEDLAASRLAVQADAAFSRR